MYMHNSSTTRPCTVQGNPATFHGWTIHQRVVGPGLTYDSPPGGQISTPLAIIEWPDGQCAMVSPVDIKFEGTMVCGAKMYRQVDAKDCLPDRPGSANE